MAFMQDAPVLILDEPTSGLDPIMQNKFIELIMKEKSNGKTIIMSSHILKKWSILATEYYVSRTES